MTNRNILRIETPRWFIPALSRDYRYLGLHGGRASAKSHTVATDIVEEVLTLGNRVVCLREVQKSLEFSVKTLLTDKIQHLGVSGHFNIKDKYISSSSGGLIIFDGMQNHTADSIKSLEGFDTLWFEEAQCASDRSITILRPTIRKLGSRMIFTWNPEKETDPIDVLLRGDSPPKRSLVIKVNFTDNPWLPDVMREEMESDRARDYEKYLHVWEGEYVKNSEKRVFKNWTVDEFDTPEDAEHRLGADWGFAKDPTVLVRCHIIGRKLYIDHEAYAVGCEIVNIPELFMSVPMAEKYPITSDSSRPETISHMRNNGFPHIRAAVKGAGSIEDGIEWLQSFDIVVHPRCKHTIDELKSYSYKVDSKTGDILSILEDKHNHVIDALRYACEGARRARTAAKQQHVTFNAIPTINSW